MSTSFNIPDITTIQSYFRGHIVRQNAEKARRELLPYELFLQAKRDFIDRPDTLDSIPIAPHGKSTVYLPESAPIVIKLCFIAEERYILMNQARSLCDSQGYSHLAIPKARRVGNFIIEGRLPIAAWSTKEQMGLYYDNKKLFTEAIKEFIGFLCQSDLPGITDCYMGRYDNICFFIENGVGKIGLVDLERFSPAVDITKSTWCCHKCEEAITLFPYHYDEIISVAKRFDPSIESRTNALVQAEKEARKLFDEFYRSHKHFLKRRAISLHNPAEKVVKLTNDRIDLLTQELVSSIKNINNNNFNTCYGCLGSDQKAALTSFAAIVPALCTMTADFLPANNE